MSGTRLIWGVSVGFPQHLKAPVPGHPRMWGLRCPGTHLFGVPGVGGFRCLGPRYLGVAAPGPHRCPGAMSRRTSLSRDPQVSREGPQVLGEGPAPAPPPHYLVKGMLTHLTAPLNRAEPRAPLKPHKPAKNPLTPPAQGLPGAGAAPGVCRTGAHQVRTMAGACSRCAPGGCQVCTRSAPWHQVCTRQARTLAGVCATCALGQVCEPGVHHGQVCTKAGVHQGRCAPGQVLARCWPGVQQGQVCVRKVHRCVHPGGPGVHRSRPSLSRPRTPRPHPGRAPAPPPPPQLTQNWPN